jgi:hypothetical protein
MNLLKHNTGNTDRSIRIMLGALLIGNVFFACLRPIAWVGVILLATGVAGTSRLETRTARPGSAAAAWAQRPFVSAPLAFAFAQARRLPPYSYRFLPSPEYF